jgi:hypothetical protein
MEYLHSEWPDSASHDSPAVLISKCTIWLNAKILKNIFR